MTNNMQLRSNIPELIEKLERIKVAVGGNGAPPAIPDFSDAMYSALNAGMGKMKFRIFNKGLDAEGNSLGKYTDKKSKEAKVKVGKKYSIGSFTPYEKKRVAHGRQIGYKDLEMEGSLRRSIEPVRIDNKQAAIVIVNEETAKISNYQEQQIGKIRGTGDAKIFAFSQEEYDQVKAECDAAISQILLKLFNE